MPNYALLPYENNKGLKAIKAIQDTTVEELLSNTLETLENIEITQLCNYALYYKNNLKIISFPNVTTLGYAAMAFTNPTSVNLPKVTTIGNYGFQSSGIKKLNLPNVITAGQRTFLGSAINELYAPKLTSIGINFFENCQIEKFDLAVLSIPSKCFYRTIGTLIILRNPSLVPLNNIDAFLESPFGLNGTGGTIYIPKALYDHLGDGTALDYKAATNWSVIDAYGTITWAQIEGSQYELTEEVDPNE